ncbi:four helix bundle protein [Rubritalea spongiae]|uniref:Four helix bundle protein n=1 Tax=Rubritalea spongiae TaxID=430797 RepID=A0ABW5E0U8_9BACT
MLFLSHRISRKRSERKSNPDSIRFLGYAKGSIAELFTQASVASNLNILPKETASYLKKESMEISSMIEALIKRLQ